MTVAVKDVQDGTTNEFTMRNEHLEWFKAASLAILGHVDEIRTSRTHDEFQKQSERFSGAFKASR